MHGLTCGPRNPPQHTNSPPWVSSQMFRPTHNVEASDTQSHSSDQDPDAAYTDRPGLMGTPERVALSIKLKRELREERELAAAHTATSTDDAMARVTSADQSTSNETSAHSDDELEPVANKTDAGDPVQARETDLERGNVANRDDLIRTQDELLNQVVSINGEKVKRVAVLCVRTLQLYRIGDLQDQLLDKQRQLVKGEGHFKGKEAKDIDRLLQKYADAIRNYETLSQDIAINRADKYEFLGEDHGIASREKRKKTIGSNLIPDLGTLPTEATVHTDPSTGPLGFRELDKKRRLERERRKAYFSRLGMAFFGGLALIVPMLIMVLRKGLVVNLVTTSVATAIFAIIVALSATDASGKDVLASTAAYAAVLIVFVGASL